ncbi:hypothetical protein HZH68_004355 [Vespula germanica]|uniref:Uncharacterized protein n=1 Tax=Vespula germanica TaxID=30212 RepID=A0A834KL53_VESGE|nr:hypothetical protein HZH68_004355 [Vespula germanica]
MPFASGGPLALSQPRRCIGKSQDTFVSCVGKEEKEEQKENRNFLLTGLLERRLEVAATKLMLLLLPTVDCCDNGTTCTHVELKQCVGVNPRGEESRVWVVRRESRYGANVRGLTAATAPTVQHSPPRGFSVPPTTSDISADPEKSEEEIDSIRDEGVGAILSERERFEVRFK